MRLTILAFAAGVWLLQQLPELPSLEWMAAGSVAAVAAIAAIAVATWRGNRLRWLAVLGVPAAFALGFAWAAAAAHWRLADRLDRDLEGNDLVLTGVVASLPQPFERGMRFEFDVERSDSGITVPRRALLTWYETSPVDEFERVVPVRAGERWRLPVRLRRPHGVVNPHGFDYEVWLLERGIGATGYVSARGVPTRLSAFVPRPQYAIERLREQLREKFRRDLPDHRYAGVLIALAVGDQRAIGPEDWRTFTRTGINHLMSISGLHVTMVAGLIAFVIYAVWRRQPALPLRLPARKAPAAAGFLAALTYCLLAGFAIPAQRTLYMIGVAAAALWLDRAQSSSKVLAVALGVVLIVDPWAVVAPGFWLSFGAVAAIFYTGVGNGTRPLRGLHAWARMQWAVTIGLAPLLLVLFKQISLVSPVANALAIPVVSLVVTPFALASTVWPGDAVARLAHALLAGLMIAMDWLASLPGAVWQQHSPIGWTVPLALIGIAWMLLPRGAPARWVGALLLLALFTVVPAPVPTGSARITFLDVGQGLAVVVRTAGHTLLYDAGPSFGQQSDAGERVVVPYLRGEGVTRLDAMVITHDDADHSGGAASVAGAVPTLMLRSSLNDTHPVRAQVPYRLPCHAGQRWRWDGVAFAMVYPPADRLDDRRVRPNGKSCVLRIDTPYGGVLLTGDIEARDEVAMLATGAPLAARVALVPHHGSRTSSLPQFVAAVGATHAVFAVGYGNRFGHPRADIYARYADARRWRTDRDGAITIDLGSQGLTVTGQRALERRYWRERSGGETE